MAEKDRFTLSREQAASRIRSKVTGFDFADTARANIATAKILGDVASSIADKTEEQNRRFDKLLKVLDFLPKDQLERRKQQKEVFVNMARLTSMIEREAKDETNPVRMIQLRLQARALRKQGRQFGGDYDSSQAQGLKENFAQRFLKISPQQLRKGGGILGAYSDELDRITGFKKVSEFLTGKRDDAFGRQVELERLFPQAAELLKKTAKYSRARGGIKDTTETGIKFSNNRGESSTRRVSGGISYGPILRQMTTTLIEIRDAVGGKKGGNIVPPTEGMEPKGLLTPEQKDLMDPRNWGIRKSGPQKGRKFWNKRNSQGKIVKPGYTEPPIPDTPPDVLDNMENFKKKKRTRVQKDFDKDFEKSRFGTSGNDKGVAEGVGTATEGASGLAEGVGGSVEGGLGILGGEAAEGITGAIGAALPEIIAAVVAAGAIATIGTAVYKWWHSNDKPMDKTSAMTGPNGKPWQSPEAYGGTVITNGTVQTPKPMTGDTIEKQIRESSPPSVVAPITNNIVNHNGGSSRGASEIGMPSVRTTDPSFIRWQDKRQSRVF